MHRLKKLFSLGAPDVKRVDGTTNFEGIKEARQQGETYINYGRRLCGIVNASVAALPPFLQRIYSQERHSQIVDEAKQRQMRLQVEKEIADIDIKISQENNNLDLQNKKIEDVRMEMEDVKRNIVGLKQKDNELNRSANIKMILGIVILVPLTIYLFTFYSSTFYSAFFKDFGTAENIGVKAAMFDPQALSKAMSEGIMELLFVLSAPIIFLGLGYSLHIYTQQKKRSKYVKIVFIVLVTLLFDCILAYLIGKSIYDYDKLNTLADMPNYSIYMAVCDANTWAVIFCGFIVYIIWGVVFDMAYTGFEDRKSTKREVEACNIKMDSFKEKLAQLQQGLTDIKNKLAQLNGDRNNRQSSLNNNIFVDLSPIKVAFSDFFSGWMTVMPALGKGVAQQEEAKNVYQTTFENLFNVTSIKESEEK